VLFILVSLLLIFLAYYNTLQSKEEAFVGAIKMQETDMYKESMVKSQYFSINTERDTIIEGVQGTKIVFTKNNFVNAKGKIISGTVQVELAEALTLEDMLKSNLTTTSGNTLLETGGMLFVNAFSQNEQVFINPDNPIYIEVPTDNFNPKMELYEGVRDSIGNMDWINPKPLQNYLVSIDLDLLDFLPKGFETEVRKHYKKPISKHVVDSTYYQLRPKTEMYRGIEVTRYGIDPLIIKTIKDPAYQNTFIATREFEARLQYLFKNPNNKILEAYLNNLDKNLWEVDEMIVNNTDSIPIMQRIEKSSNDNKVFTVTDTLSYKYEFMAEKSAFEDFAMQRKTNVKDGAKYAKVLQGFYEQKLKENYEKYKEVEAQIKRAEAVEKKELNRLLAEYQQVKDKRHTYRMLTYGFTLTKTGWINIDNGSIPKDWEYQSMDVVIAPVSTSKDAHYDVYMVYESINSLLRLEEYENNSHFVINRMNNDYPIFKNETLYIIALGTDKEKHFLGSFKTSNREMNALFNHITLECKQVTPLEITALFQMIKANYKIDMAKDQDLLKKIHIEEEKYKPQLDYFNRLIYIAFPN